MENFFRSDGTHVFFNEKLHEVIQKINLNIECIRIFMSSQNLINELNLKRIEELEEKVKKLEKGENEDH